MRCIKIISEEICREYNVDISPEVNQDRGCLDFKFSNGRLKVVVEVKLTSGDLIHGYEKQLPEYMRAEDTSKGIFLVIINTKNPDDKIEVLHQLSESPWLKENGEDFPEIIIIDGRKKQSASKV